MTFDLNDPSQVTLFEGPKNGVLELSGSYVYRPNEGYLGSDQMIFSVEAKGKIFKVIYSVDVARAPDYGSPNCPNSFGIKELPNPTKDGDKGSALDILELPIGGLLDAEALAQLHAMVSFSMGSGILGDGGLLNIADLPGGAVGQTIGEGVNATIPLDDNAAGHNWFIDTTPWYNSEYLPTSNPYEWVAKEGTAAYGKMDMLSVLLHEYGHALGIEHSADNHDYMATTLTPGVRRMPSADELALMQELIGQARGDLVGRVTPADSNPDNTPMPLPIPLGAGFGMAFIGRMRKSSYGGTSIDFAYRS